MTAADVAVAPSTPARSAPKATVADLLLSEWTKLRSVRSTYWALFIGAVLAIGLGAIISKVSANHYASDPTVHLNWSATDRSFNSLGLAQLAFAVLGVLVMSGEYSTGMIRTTLAAVPNRRRLLAAKTAVFAGLTVVAGEVIAFITFLVGQALIHGRAPSANLGQPGVLRAVIGAGLYLAAVALVGLGLGTILRHAAAGIGVIVALLFVLPAVAQALPTSWANPLEEYWPTNAGSQVSSVGRSVDHFLNNGHVMAPWTGFGVMCAFVAAVLFLGFVALERLDA